MGRLSGIREASGARVGKIIRLIQLGGSTFFFARTNTTGAAFKSLYSSDIFVPRNSNSNILIAFYNGFAIARRQLHHPRRPIQV